MYLHMYIYIQGTGWRRPIGCLKLQVIVRKKTTNYRALWQKMTYEDKASYDSTPPFPAQLFNCTVQGGKDP